MKGFHSGNLKDPAKDKQECQAMGQSGCPKLSAVLSPLNIDEILVPGVPKKIECITIY
jgi:hypothetical protein